MSWSCEGFQPGTPLRQPAPATSFVPSSLHCTPGPVASLQTVPAGGDPSPQPRALPLPGPQPRQFVAMLVAGPPRHGARAPPGPWDAASPRQRPPPPPQGPRASPAPSVPPPGQDPKCPPGPAPLGCGVQPAPQLGFPHLNQKQRGGATAPPLRGPFLRLRCRCFLFSLAFMFILPPRTPAPFPHFVTIITINTKVLRLRRDYKNINE